MVKIKCGDREFFMEGYLNTNLETATKVIRKDWDMIFLADGAEGAGKSVLIQQVAYKCDSTFNIDRIVFTPIAFQKAIKTASKYQAIVYDEAYTGLSSRAAMSMINRTLIKMLAEIRQKNLFIFIVCPCFFDIDKYVALWRSRALIHIYTRGSFERGYFAFYNMDKKKTLYVLGKKYYNYSKPDPNFRGCFPNFYVVNEKDYRKKKAHSLIKREEDEETKRRTKEMEDELFKRVVQSKNDISHEIKIKLLGIPRASYFYKLRKAKEESEFVDEFVETESEEGVKPSV